MVFKKRSPKPSKKQAESLFVAPSRFPMDKVLETTPVLDFDLTEPVDMSEVDESPLLVDPDIAPLPVLFDLDEVEAFAHSDKSDAMEVHEGVEQHDHVFHPPDMPSHAPPPRLLNIPLAQMKTTKPKIIFHEPAASSTKLVVGLTHVPLSQPTLQKEPEIFEAFDMSFVDLDFGPDIPEVFEPIMIEETEAKEIIAVTLENDLAAHTPLERLDFEPVMPAEEELDADDPASEVDIVASTLLTEEFVLMLVHHDQTYALIVDNGENAVVLKLFDTNPLFDNLLFEVCEEAQVSESKRLYMVQAGEWHGIIALESDEPKLQVELDEVA